MSTWSIDVPHDAAVSYVDIDSDLYDVTCNDADGVLSAVATHKTAFSSDPDALTGVIELGVLEFKVAANTDEGMLESVFAMDVISLVSLASFEYVNGVAGSIYDQSGFKDTGSRLDIADRKSVV